MPRIRHWKELNLGRPPGEHRYLHIDSLFNTQVEWDLIETMLPDMLRVALSIKVLDGCRPRPSSRADCKEIPKRFWDKGHHRGARKDYRQLPNCCASGVGPRPSDLGTRQARRMGGRRIDRPG